MATTTTTVVPVVTVVSFGADDFVSNFVSDLAPLLALFGDQATKQFLSLSMGWADNVMVAMGPLGILTIVVSAIRVSKLKWLKALIGRARESFAAAEVEVLSSTSEDVCERYNGNEIIRIEGKTKTKEFIFRLWMEGDRRTYFGLSDSFIHDNWVFDLKEACSTGVIQPEDYLSKRKWQWKDFFPLRSNKTKAKGNEEDGPASHVNENQEIGRAIFEHLQETAPNITLHVPNAVVPPWELWTFAVFGVSVQSAVLVLSGITIYRWHFQKSGAIVSNYAYPCFLVGTIALSAGLLICARIIQGSTENTNFVLAKPPIRGVSDAVFRENSILHRAPYQIVRIQRCAEQETDSWAIFNHGTDGILRTSRSRGPRYTRMSALGSSLAVIGYLAQYLGSRGLPWSTTVMQLVATVMMAAARAYVRRGLANEPLAFNNGLKDHELSWLARKICGSGALKTVSGSLTKKRRGMESEYAPSSTDLLPMQLKRILNASKIVHRNLDYQVFAFSSKPILKGLIDTHMRLQQLSAWTYPYENLVDNLVSAMAAVLTTFNRESIVKGQKKIEEVKFDLPNVLFCNRGQDLYEPEVATLHLAVRLSDLDSGGAFAKRQLGAILDLWTEGHKPDNKVSGSRSEESNHRTRREEIGYNDDPKNFRVIGSVIPCSLWTARRLHILQNFIPQEGLWLVHPSDGTHQYSLISTVNNGFIEYALTSAMTYGLLFSSLFRSKLIWVEGKRDTTASQGTMAMSSSNQDNDGHSNNSDEVIEPLDLALFSTNSAEVDCAHDIFSAFMLGMARDIVKLGGGYKEEFAPTKITSDIEQDNCRRLWSNTIIDQLANAVRASSLVGDSEEAYVLIVPALASEDLLPEVSPDGGRRETASPEGHYPYGERLYNGFNLSAFESEIWRWFQASFPTQDYKRDMENFDRVADFIFKPEDGLSTRNEETTTVCNRTRAAMYLLRDIAIKNGRSPRRPKGGRGWRKVMHDLEEAHNRMVPGFSLPDEEELKQMYPNLLSDISSIAEGGGPKKASIDA